MTAPGVRTRRRRSLQGLTAAGAMLLTGLISSGPATAAAQTHRQAVAFPAAGATITCGSTVIHTTAGQLVGQFHETLDSAGLFHYEGTNVARGVVGVDDSGASYRIVGTSSFSGTSTDPAGLDNVRWHNTVELVVLAAERHRIGKVGLVERLNEGADVVLSLGDCTGSGGGDDDLS